MYAFDDKSLLSDCIYSEESILRQLRVAQSKLDLMPHLSLRQGMEIYLRDLGFVILSQFILFLLTIS